MVLVLILVLQPLNSRNTPPGKAMLGMQENCSYYSMGVPILMALLMPMPPPLSSVLPIDAFAIGRSGTTGS